MTTASELDDLRRAATIARIHVVEQARHLLRVLDGGEWPGATTQARKSLADGLAKVDAADAALNRAFEVG